MITGQFLDVSVQARGRADVDAAMTVLRYKSAKYSIERPLHIGAALAGAGAGRAAPSSRRSGCRSARRSSSATTCSGVYGDPAATGKPAGDDLVEGKRTVLVALALDGAPADDAARLDAALGTPLDERRRSPSCARIIDASGAHAQVEQVIGELVDAVRWPRSTRPPYASRRATGAAASWPSAATDRVV